MDKQDWYFGQVVSADEMDTLYTDMANAEERLALESQLSQTDQIADIPKYGGIMKGFVPTKTSGNPKSLDITPGSARDGLGRRISTVGKTASPSTPVTLSLANLGATPEGTVVTATGDGALTAAAISAGEAWISVFAVYDTHLSDTRVDSLGNTISFRQEDSFHFEIEVGTDAALGTATSRPNLAINKVLICDCLLDNNGDIRTISLVDAVVSSSKDLNLIGYGLDDTPALAGRRSDWCSVDPDGTSFDLLKDAYDNTQPNNKAYYSIRAGTPREAIRLFLEIMTEPGSVNKAGGSEILGARPISGKVLSSPGAAAALQMPTGSIHTQLEALYDKVNTLLSRGSDTLTGNLTITGTLTISTNLVVTGNYTSAAGNITLTAGDLILTSGDATIGGTLGVTGLTTLQALNVEGLAQFGNASPKMNVQATSEQRWGVDGTYTTGRTKMLPNGRLLMGDGYRMEPLSSADTPAEHSGAFLTLPTDPLHYVKGKYDTGSGTISDRKTTAWGRKAYGNRVHCDFTNLREGINPGTSDPARITTGGAGTETIITAFRYVQLQTGATSTDSAHIRFGACISKILITPSTIKFYTRLAVLSGDTNVQVFAGLYPRVPSAGYDAGVILPDKHAGFFYNAGGSAGNWFFRLGDGTIAESADTGVAVSLSSVIDMYFAIHSGTPEAATYWLTGMAAPALLTTTGGFGDLYEDYIPFVSVMTLAAAVRTLQLYEIEAWDNLLRG